MVMTLWPFISIPFKEEEKPYLSAILVVASTLSRHVTMSRFRDLRVFVRSTLFRAK